MTSSVLVTGGAGYIGSHLVHLLNTTGVNIVVLDNMTNPSNLDRSGVTFYEGDIREKSAVSFILRRHQVDRVFHFASKISVGDSVKDPLSYYDDLAGTLSLLDCMRKNEVRKIVFSSSAAVFGNSGHSYLKTYDHKSPASPYGRMKSMTEDVLVDCASAYGIGSVSLRYFNAAGAHPDGILGERHDPETHLIPLLLRSILTGETVTIYGDDYSTPDGTCIRDYVHVCDLAQAHLLAMYGLDRNPDSAHFFNLGSGEGYSVFQVIAAITRLTGKSPKVEIGPRRPGDPDRLVADSSHANQTLGWKRMYNLDQIIQHAWNFEKTKS